MPTSTDGFHYCVHPKESTKHRCKCSRTHDHWELYRADEQPGPTAATLF